jgi:hypothetical protein
VIWLAWRQQRTAVLGGLAAIAVVVVALVLSGLSMRAEFDRLGLGACAAPTDFTCTELTRTFTDRYTFVQLLLPFALVIPALLGVLWGAPLVAREVEHGTHRMVWTQSVSRRRWLLTKVAVVAGATVVGLGALSLATAWWMQPLMDTRSKRFEPGIFDSVGVAPVAYGLAALLLGVAAGAWTRKLVPAMALALVLFVVLRVGVDVGIRPNFMEPVRATFALPLFGMSDEDDAALPTEWVLVLETRTSEGQVVSDGVGIDFDLVKEVCPEAAMTDEPVVLPPPGAGPAKAPDDPNTPMARCAERNGFHVAAVYHPPDRFWRFQLTEAALFVGLSAALLGASLWWIRHRVS